LLKLDNEAHRWEGLWSGGACTKGSSTILGHSGAAACDNVKKKPRAAAHPLVAQTMAVYTGFFTGIQNFSPVLYLGCKTTGIF